MNEHDNEPWDFGVAYFQTKPDIPSGMSHQGVKSQVVQVGALYCRQLSWLIALRWVDISS
jgi:hypothetical protein